MLGASLLLRGGMQTSTRPATLSILLERLQHKLIHAQARGLRTASIPTKARLTYFQDTSLRLDLQYKKADEWLECFTLGAVAIPSVAYLGFSAETGELTDNHDIVSVDVRNLYAQPDKEAPQGSRRGSGRGRKQKMSGEGGGSWGWMFFKVLMFFGLIGGGYAGYNFWRTRQRNKRF